MGIQGIRGRKGDTGLRGPEGPIGPCGKTGERGPIGPKGETGEKGEQGENGLNGEKGEQGERGPKGQKGDPGPEGPQGPRGIQGLKGNDGVKTFVIDNPIDNNKYLVHACLEGPEASVFYRGKSSIKNNNYKTIIDLPKYFRNLVDENSITIQLQVIDNNDILRAEYNENKIIVYADQCELYWHVFSNRNNCNFEV